MSRHNPPDHRDPRAFDGLRKRRRERGLPTGTIITGPNCPYCGAGVDPAAKGCPNCKREFRR